MSHWREFAKAPKKPPPAHGVRMKKAGTTWWGQRWIEALQNVLRGDAGRLARGRTYARAGRAHDLTVRAGKVTAKVTGTRATPYAITLVLAPLGDADWNRAIAALAAKAHFSAELLAGRMPADVDDALRAVGIRLFPAERADLATTCSCPDWGDPCKHVAATHYLLGEALDRDPFLLFELRGRDKEAVLGALRAARAGSDAAPKGSSRTRRSRPVTEIPTVRWKKVAAADYDRPRDPLPPLDLSFDAPTADGAILRQLGVPAAWEGAEGPAEVLAPVVRRAAEAARRIALAEAREEAAASGGSGRGRRRKSRS